MKTKICTKCLRALPETIEYFNRKGKNNDAPRTVCKLCEKDYRTANKSHKQHVDRNYRERNRDKIVAQKSEYYRQNKEQENNRYYAWRDANREHYTKYQRAYTSKRKRCKQEYDRQYREANRSKITARQRRWTQEHIEHARMKGRIAASRYLARKRNASGDYTEQDIKRILKAQRGKCYYCGKKVSDQYHIDHVVPLSRGGANSPNNLVVTCPHCNVTKSSKMPHEWPDGGRLL